ncbi:MAG: DUF1801 domain-containing protein [Bacteroidales bacterium]|nr:DUF1801 domain-containing protein [Bacteroidales bacterium]
MKIIANTPGQYIEQLPEDRKAAFTRLRKIILQNLPDGFVETMSYGMIGYVVPHSVYQPGYHCDTKLPLPFMSIASQKNYVAIYHMGMYAEKELLDWFIANYPKHTAARLDLGKSCIRFKKPDQIPYELIGELAGKMSVAKWIEIYEKNIKQ